MDTLLSGAHAASRRFPLLGRMSVDWLLFGAAFALSLFGLLTMNSLTGDNSFFDKQIIWLSVSVLAFFVASAFDYRFLRRTWVIVALFFLALVLLSVLFGIGTVAKGAQSWLSFGGFSFQPAELTKIVLIILLAKYFSRRHIEIANIRHIFVSGVYAGILALLVLLQPDFGSAVIIGLVWFGMVLVSGISKKHLLAVSLAALVAFGALWGFVFEEYQKQRIMTFIHPLADIRGAGYNAYQSMVAVGSGELLGKGIGYGTQSKLKFLPEYETDFIFAAFAEEWGFVGVLLLFACIGILFWRILRAAYLGETNFEILFGLGLLILFLAHFTINAGMNIGLLPVTGITFPFMSYGGTHLLISYTALGMLSAMRRYRRVTHKEETQYEFLGVN
jgi:rod shape determining protein RodA